MKKLVKITKISASEKPEYATPNWKDYELGKINGNMSIPTDYFLEGYLLKEIKIGEPVMVERISRNGQKIGGFFTTSTVLEFSWQEKMDYEFGIFKTLNSIYKLEYISK